jgi:hypothetical protein
MRTLRFVFGMDCARFAGLLAAIAAGCTSSSNEPVGGALGESCTRKADCQSGLACVANVCGGMHPIGAAGLDGSADASGPEAGADAGGAESGIDEGAQSGLGRIGEVCQTSRDCASGLDCVPSPGGASVCDIVSYGVMAGSKTCSGECSTATDCCDLPPGLSLSGTNDAGVFVSASNCQDILLVLLGGNTSVCATHPLPGSSAASACFFYQTYCGCAANTWSCSSGRCIYTASCQGTFANTLGGCPSFTRTRSALNTTCDMPGNTCRTASSACSTAADCDGLFVTDTVGVTCRGGDCACYTGACYLKCARDLDCQSGYSCDASKKLCVPAPCSNDAECFSRLGKARAKCKAGTCGIPCSVDHDCSPSGDIPGQPFNGTVCGTDGVCAPVGCASDADCSGAAGPRLFCVTPPSVSTVHSAIGN